MKAKLSSKNQIVIPKEARERMGLKRGEQVILAPKGRCLVLMKTPQSYTKSRYGFLKSDSKKSLISHVKKSRSEW